MLYLNWIEFCPKLKFFTHKIQNYSMAMTWLNELCFFFLRWDMNESNNKNKQTTKLILITVIVNEINSTMNINVRYEIINPDIIKKRKINCCNFSNVNILDNRKRKTTKNSWNRFVAAKIFEFVVFFCR